MRSRSAHAAGILRPSGRRWCQQRLGYLWVGIALLFMMQPALVPAEAGARIALNPLSFGNNIDESLINPTEPGKSEAQLTEQVAGILHGVRMDGGRTVRWFVTSVWPQYLCARDPENQATGELDPAWFTISRILLQQAEKEGIAVVIVLADTANGTFAGLSSNQERRASVIARWHQHHAALPTAAGGRISTVECERGFQNGYYGRMRPAGIWLMATGSLCAAWDVEANATGLPYR